MISPHKYTENRLEIMVVTWCRFPPHMMLILGVALTVKALPSQERRYGSPPWCCCTCWCFGDYLCDWLTARICKRKITQCTPRCWWRKAAAAMRHRLVLVCRWRCSRCVARLRLRWGSTDTSCPTLAKAPGAKAIFIIAHLFGMHQSCPCVPEGMWFCTEPLVPPFKTTLRA